MQKCNESSKVPIKMQRMQGEASFTAFLRDGKTVLQDLYQSGSAKLRFPLYAHNDLEAIMINSAGGSTGGDSLNWGAKVRAGTTAIITSQANEKIYRAKGKQAVKINIDLELEENSKLYWLPQETIFFDKAALERQINVNIADNCTLLMVESFIFGRILMGEAVKNGFLQDRWFVRQNGKLCHAEALKLKGDLQEILKKTSNYNEMTAFANLVYIAKDYENFENSARAIIADNGAVSAWNGKLIARLIDKDCYSLRKKITLLIKLITKNQSVPKTWTL